MKTFSIRKKQCVVWTVVPFFLFSFISITTPLEASSGTPLLASPSRNLYSGTASSEILTSPSDAGGEGLNAESNPLATQAEDFYIPSDAVRVGGRIEGRVSQVYLDPVNTERIYLLSEISQDGVLTLKYIYNDVLGTVTLLSSFTKTNAEPRFTHYYRYAQGAHSSLELILEEGLVRGDLLLPSKVYDYFRGVVNVRTLDRAGNILKLESSAGVTRHFIYSRNGRLLTVEEADASGGLSFYDQVSNTKDWDLPPVNIDEDRRLFALPDRGKEKLTTPTGYSHPRLGEAAPWGRVDDSQNRSQYFLLWLESAHPLRAGPVGGLL